MVLNSKLPGISRAHLHRSKRQLSTALIPIRLIREAFLRKGKSRGRQQTLKNIASPLKKIENMKALSCDVLCGILLLFINLVLLVSLSILLC